MIGFFFILQVFGFTSGLIHLVQVGWIQKIFTKRVRDNRRGELDIDFTTPSGFSCRADKKLFRKRNSSLTGNGQIKCSLASGMADLCRCVF